MVNRQLSRIRNWQGGFKETVSFIIVSSVLLPVTVRLPDTVAEKASPAHEMQSISSISNRRCVRCTVRGSLIMKKNQFEGQEDVYSIV